MKFSHAALLALSLSLPLLPGTAIAGMDEGIAAYNKGDDAKAFREFKPLADQGNSEAQLRLGDLYRLGRGVVRADSKEAMKWYRLAADQGNSVAQTNLGLMYGSDAAVFRQTHGLVGVALV